MNVLEFLRQPLKRTAPDTDTGIWPAVGAFWDSLSGAGYSPRMLERVWCANRCVQLNSQQISSMPLRFYGKSPEPRWTSNPDPNWYPNGISDAIFACVWSMYGWGDAFIFITDRYADGFPSAWTVLDPAQVSVELVNGRRQYRSASVPLDPGDVVQISRDPRGGLRGTSALRSYAPHVAAAITSSELGKQLMGGGVPNAILKSDRKLTQDEAQKLQLQWKDASELRRGAPAVLPPEISFETLAFSPKDLMLLEGQQFEARVIASAFGVPASKLNIPLEGGLTYQSPGMLFTDWWRTELRPMSMRLTQGMSAQMLPRGSYVASDARDVLAPEFSDLVSSWQTMLAAGVVTNEEFRAVVLGLPPQSEAESLDDLTVPAVADANNVQPLRPVQLTGMEVTST